MIELEKIQNVYLVGIGGIGMSALARYFKTLDKFVAGYDKTPSAITDALIAEGIAVHFDDNLSLVPEPVLRDKENTLVIYTPAVPNYHYEFNYFKEREYLLIKRAEVLGHVFSTRRGIAVAGTHGKTTTSTMLAHLLKQSVVDCSAFLGGISSNYGTNLLLSATSNIIVTEADEFDRSFLRLFPQLAIVTSVDADHLDIYGTHQEVLKSFNQFIGQIQPTGTLIYKKGIKLDISSLTTQKVYTYSAVEIADFYPVNTRIDTDGLYIYDLKTPMGMVYKLKLGIPGHMNLENSIAAAAAALIYDVEPDELRAALASFTGVKRRFEYQIKTENLVYIDDYAHHPEELRACIGSVRKLYANKHITGVFQPHLFTRTRDFYTEFAQSLSLLDEVILLDIYPARELPIEGVSSALIFDLITCRKKLIHIEQLVEEIANRPNIQVLITLGAGDIDRCVGPIKELLLKK